MLLVLSLLVAAGRPAMALDITGDLVIVVKGAGGNAPLAGATVRVAPLSGQGDAVERTTGADGVARFRSLVIGDYGVQVTRAGFTGDSLETRLTAGSVLTLQSALRPVAPSTAKEPASNQVIEVRATRILVNTTNPIGNGNRLDLARSEVAQLSSPNGTQAIVSMVPGIQTNSLGQFHPRGEHKGVGVSIDGINIPLPSEDATSQIIDPRLMETMEVQTGFFDAAAGGEAGAILNIKTLEGPKKAYAEFIPTVGTFDTHGGVLRTGGSARAGKLRYFFGATYTETDNKIEPVEAFSQTLGNHGKDTNMLLRVSDIVGPTTYGATFSFLDGHYGLPQTRDNFLAGVDQSQEQHNFISVVSARKRIDDTSEVLFGLAYLRSSQSVGNNGVFTPFAISTASPDLQGANLPVDPEHPGSPYLPNVFRVINQLQPTLEFTKEYPHDHHVKIGATADRIDTHESDDILDAGGGGALPGGVAEFVADVHRHAILESAYASDTFPVGKRLNVNAGLRAERFDDQANGTFKQLSPRVNLSYALNDRSAIKLSYDRIFIAPPVETDTSGGSFAIPQRTHQTELAYEFEPAKEVVARVAGVYKDYTDQLDVGLVIANSNIPVFGPVNFGKGLYRGLEISANSYHRYGWNGHVAATLFATAKPISPGQFNPDVPGFNDHDQRTQVTGSASYTWKKDITATVDALYASGFPQDTISAYNAVGINPFGLVGDRFSRFISNFSLNYSPRDEKGKVRDNALGGSLVVQNLNDDRSVVNFLSGFSGTRFVQGRRALLTASYRF